MAPRDAGQEGKLPLRYAEAPAMSAPQRTCLPRGCDAFPGTAARLPERKSLQQPPEEDTSKQDSVR